MRNVANWIEKEGQDKNVRLLLQVHDELIFEIKTEEIQSVVPMIIGLMEGVLSGKDTHGVPLLAEAKVGDNWQDLEVYRD
jgi:DNA polymerase-1